MRDYEAIFSAIIDAMRTDYVGCRTRRAFDNPGPYIDEFARRKSSGEDPDLCFIEAVQRYLSCFKDPFVSLETDPETVSPRPFRRGFHVRRFGDALYVTRVDGEERLFPGDRIDKMDGHPIHELARRYAANLYGTIEERELWDDVLRYHRHLTLHRVDGTDDGLDMARYDVAGASGQNSYRRISDGTCLLTIGDLDDEAAVESLVEMSCARSANDRVIIDVRHCAGGHEESFRPLLPFVIAPGMDLGGYLLTDFETNFTHRNCELQRMALLPLVAQTDEKTTDAMRSILLNLDANDGRGFVPQHADLPEEWNEPLLPADKPARTIILTDVTCQGAAETFCAIGKEGRATTVGRATMGGLGHFNQARKPLDDGFSLVYPISRYLSPYAQVGVPVDIHVNWTPACISTDLALYEALS